MNRLVVTLLISFGLIPIQAFAEELRVWNRRDGTVVRLESIKAITSSSVGDDYGRFLKWEYSVERGDSITKWSVVGDCQSLSADWDDDREGFIDLRRPTENSAIEARSVLNEFCPQMNRLVKEAKGLTKKPINKEIKSNSNKLDSTRKSKKSGKGTSKNKLFEKCKDAQDFEGCIDVFSNKKKEPKRIDSASPSRSTTPIRQEPIQLQQQPQRTLEEPVKKKIKNTNEPAIPEKLSPIQKACIDARATGYRGYYSQRLKVKCRKVLKSIPFF